MNSNRLVGYIKMNLKYFPIIVLCISIALVRVASAESRDSIKIGALFSLSSWGAEGGSSELNGALMAQEEINASGGILGKKLEFVVEDNRSDLKTTATAFNKIVHIDKVAAVIGPNWAEFLEIAAPLAQRNKVVLISPSGFKEEVIKTRDYVFSLWPSHVVSTCPLTDFIGKKRPKKLKALITENAYQVGILEGARENLLKQGVRIDEEIRFNEGVTDYRSVISRLKKSDTDALLLLMRPAGEFSSFLKQSKQLGLGLTVYSANEIPFSEVVQKNPEIAEGVIYFDFIVPGSKDFRESYRKKFSKQPGFSSAQAYDSIYLLKRAIEECGPASKQIKECLQVISYTGESGHIAFDEGGLISTVKKNTTLLQVKNGKFEILEY